ncbi:MAG: ATP-binding protein [Desulfobacterales bacterium]|nr:MAG: ATP-binding protein [Desulfobacterales bacterium]
MLVGYFGLSPFERDLLLLCAGTELDSRMADLCALCQGDPLRRTPTFGLALAVLPEAHWSALTPDGPLRYWRLIEVGPGDFLTTSPLRIDERILHYLAGTPHLDERLRGVVVPVHASAELSPCHRDISERISRVWSKALPEQSPPLIQLCGKDRQTIRAVVVQSCRANGLGLFRLAAADIPGSTVERTALIRLTERESLLSAATLLVEWDDTVEPDRLHPSRFFIHNFRNMLLVSTREPLSFPERISVRFSIASPSASEQREVWVQVLGPLASRLNGHIDRIVSHFRMNGSAIRAAGNEILQALDSAPGDRESANDPLATNLWEICRTQSRPQFNNLARRIPATAHWDDLVLPEPQKQTLRELVASVRQQARVYEEWGFAERSPRGLGITALFHGPSGTGKTMGAEVLANELRLDLYHIDLSTVVSKYIGETEKNLRQVFDAAEQGGLILLFDEADALFGKRSEVKDSHDRYANIEVSYLLQRMEAYRGLAILTTNNKSALDPAFLRRIRFVIQFPFPDASQRAEIWKRIFPGRTPVRDLNERKLARLNVAGGNIRNIALNAAFLAADQDRPVTMGDIRQAAQSEYLKIEKPLSAAETRDWL